MLNPSLVAFRFQAYGNTYAVDIKAGIAVLLVDKASGWQIVPELPFLSATDGVITAAGGPVKFANVIVDAVNAVLALLLGRTVTPSSPLLSPLSLREEVLAELRTQFRVHELMDGSVELQRKLR